MNDVLEWLSKYSPAMVFLIAFGAALVFILRQVTEKAISTQFDRYKREMELKLERRSNFEEKILVDRSTVLRDFATRIGRVMTDLNRARHGTQVEGLMRNGDIVPLTEVFELLAVNRYLITERFHGILWQQSQLLISLANERDSTKVGAIQNQYVKLLDEFYDGMNEMFGIDRITWETHAS